MRSRSSRRAGRLFFVLLAAGSVCLSQGTPQGADEKPVSVEGVVSNSLTGEPLPRAHVTLRSFTNGTLKNYGALTNAAGKFSIAGLPPGRYVAGAERVGFVARGDAGGLTDDMLVELRPGDKKDDVKLKLTPLGAITGRVIDADGNPVEGANMTAERGGFGGINAPVTTDESGQFRIGGLGPGKYRIKARPQYDPLPPEIRTDGTTEAQYAATYYPSSLAPKYAARVEVPAGAEVGGIDIRLVRVPIVRVSGTVSGIPEGARNVSLNIFQARGFGPGRPVKADGSFQIWRLDPGKYSLTATVRGLVGPPLQTAREEIEVSESNIDNLELRVVSPSDIPGQLEFDDEQAKPPQAGQQQIPQLGPLQGPQLARRQPVQPGRQPAVQASQQQPGQPRSQLSLRDLVGGTQTTPAAIAADGSFRLEQLPPGRFRVILSWGPAYVKSIRLGSTEMEGGILDLRYGSGGAALTVVVSSATGSVSGAVYDNKGAAAGVQIVLFADDPGDTSSQFTMAGAAGTYSFSTLAPGKYWIAALGPGDSGRGLRYLDRDDYGDLMESIEVHASDRLSKDLKVRVPGAQ